MLKNKKSKFFFLLCLFVFLFFFVFFINTFIGLLDFSVKDYLAFFKNLFFSPFKETTNDDYSINLIIGNRISRFFMSFLVGAGLAIAGLAVHSLFRNPLADVGLLGISIGCVFGVVFYIVILASLINSENFFLSPYILVVVSFVSGAVISSIIYFFSAKSSSVILLLLIGIGINSFFAALVALIMYFSDEQQLRTVTFWTMGYIGSREWKEVFIVFGFIIFPFYWFIKRADVFNAYIVGEDISNHLGIDVVKFKKKNIIFIALITGCCISFTGMIGFVGLIIPHFLRLLVGSNHKILFPLSALLGGIFVSFCDFLSRTLIPPVELPIGIITALIGTPIFLFLLIKRLQRVF